MYIYIRFARARTQIHVHIHTYIHTCTYTLRYFNANWITFEIWPALCQRRRIYSPLYIISLLSSFCFSPCAFLMFPLLPNLLSSLTLPVAHPSSSFHQRRRRVHRESTSSSSSLSIRGDPKRRLANSSSSDGSVPPFSSLPLYRCLFLPFFNKYYTYRSVI